MGSKGQAGLKKYRESGGKYVGVTFVRNVMPWIERYYHTHKMFPSESLLMTQFNMDQEKCRALFNNALFKQACEDRGLVRRTQHLTDKQVACIAVMTNTMDPRTIDIKLASVGVTPEQYQGWLSQPVFKQELFIRSSEILDNLSPVAHHALADQVKKGNMQAIKTYYEMTGQSQSQETMNAQRLVQRTLEALQKHVRDPETLLAISKELLGEAPELAQIEVVQDGD